MRKFLVPLVLVASVAGATLAVAAETAKGAITKIDAKNCTVTLSDSKAAYRFGPNCDFSGLKVGQKVQISWVAAANLRLASRINPY